MGANEKGRSLKGDGKGRLFLQVRIRQEIVFKIRDLAAAHGISTERTVEWALRNLLTQAGIRLKPEQGAGEIVRQAGETQNPMRTPISVSSPMQCTR
jgi:hypothetical protein